MLRHWRPRYRAIKHGAQGDYKKEYESGEKQARSCGGFCGELLPKSYEMVSNMIYERFTFHLKGSISGRYTPITCTVTLFMFPLLPHLVSRP